MTDHLVVFVAVFFCFLSNPRVSVKTAALRDPPTNWLFMPWPWILCGEISATPKNEPVGKYWDVQELSRA